MEIPVNSKILIVDDKQQNVSLLETMLEGEGYSDILGITDSRNAADIYQSYEPDIVLLDLNMPYLDGFQVMAQLKNLEQDSYTPVLVLTALQDEEIRLKALESGAKDFLSKPFNRTEVLSRIKNILEVRLLHNKIKEQNEKIKEQNTQLEQHNIILEVKVKERTRELQDTRLEIIRRLGLAAEYRDNETGYHIIRMSKMSKVLAKAIGMTENESDIILQASPMHDIGKIGIPDSVLLKPGKLELDEWKIMKTHTSIGEKLLSGHPSILLEKAKEIAVSHHEKWDGSGYPLGLKGADIPLSGRICALADVFDALTSIRPYKKAWTVTDAVAEIQKGKGLHFDSDLVEAFESRLEDFIAIKNQFKEPED